MLENYNLDYKLINKYKYLYTGMVYELYEVKVKEVK